jgi:hypothetical protein
VGELSGPALQCQHCEDTYQHLTSDCFLAPHSIALSAGKSAGALAVVAGFIAAAKLACVESREQQNKSPRARLATSDSITIANGNRGDESETMTWQQIQAEALRIVDEVAQRRSDLELSEYQSRKRYRADHPGDGRTMHDHNAIVREAMREAARHGVFCVRRMVR